jgi:hypothetical protein
LQSAAARASFDGAILNAATLYTTIAIDGEEASHRKPYQHWHAGRSEAFLSMTRGLVDIVEC